MKTNYKLLVSLIMLLCAVSMQAQISFSVNLRPPPPWGPAGHAQVRYYYLPDVEAYYDVQSSMFIYFSGTAWVHRPSLPSRYRNYDLYRGYKVVMPDYHGKAPYVHYKEHRSKYHKGYHRKQQRTVGVKPPARESYRKQDGHGKGNGNRNDKSNGKGHGKSHDKGKDKRK